jgi:hypothetical protein
MITSNWQEIRAMHSGKKTRFVCANFMLNSNHKDAIKAGRNDRRFAIFYTAQQTKEDLPLCGMDGDYFVNLYNWLKREGYAIVNDYLSSYAIPAALNPAGACNRAPKTSSTEEAVRQSKGSIAQEIEAAVLEDRIGFRGGWISGHYLEMLIKDLGAFNRVARNKRVEILQECGYIPHPGVKNGTPHSAVQPEGRRATLYIKEDSPHISLKGGEVGLMYSHAQTAPAHLKLAV